jgi:tetratricopeptide (TPR) repeat protein
VNRTAHNLSAHYNGYYNAGLKLEEALDKLAASHTDHYDRILTVFQYADATKAKAIYPLLEDAMKRTSTVISRHTMLDKRGYEKPESEKWIDDNWILYGKCQFFKHDYFEAMESFRYVEATYKKEPGRHIASLWIAKTFLELTQLREAEAKLDYLRNQSDFPKKDKWELEAVNADFYLQTKNFEKAQEHITRAAALVKNREKKIRYHFILAQLLQQKGDYKQAFDLYTKIIKMNPPYEMAFNARLNRARCFESGSAGGESVQKELLKMESDPKNKDFLDQIYYALAGLKKNEGNQEEQINYLNLSVQSSTKNQNQKALSYLELAKIAYGKPDYRTAQGYYDSTITNLGKDYPDYTEILTRRNSLTKLVKYMKIIELEDSLLQLSNLSREDQIRKIDAIIVEDERKREEAKAAVKESTQSNQIFDPSRQSEANQFNKGSGSSWYFYNPQAISFGFNEFAKKFGKRKLEDNWRRSKKEATIDLPNELVALDSNAVAAGGDTSNMTPLKRREEMLKSIPSGGEAIEKSTAKIIDAYYNIGTIYREQLEDLGASAEAFEELLRLYPDNKYRLQCYYQLYRTYATLGNTAKSEYYRNIILTQHGDSEYAEIIRNPNYAAERANRKSNLEVFYEDTYRKYLNGEYSDVIVRKAQSDIQFPENPLTPKFDFLKTLSIGKTQPLPVFEASLNEIVRNYAADSVKDAAQDILDYLHKSKGTDAPATAPAPDTSSAGRLYTYLPDTLHNVVLIFQNINGPLNPDKLKNKISDFNAKNFGSKNITFQDLLFDHRLVIFILRTFSNKQEALLYANVLFDNDDVFGNVSNEAYQLYAISVNNLPALLAEKKTTDYENFYRSFYK